MSIDWVKIGKVPSYLVIGELKDELRRSLVEATKLAPHQIVISDVWSSSRLSTSCRIHLIEIFIGGLSCKRIYVICGYPHGNRVQTLVMSDEFIPISELDRFLKFVDAHLHTVMSVTGKCGTYTRKAVTQFLSFFDVTLVDHSSRVIKGTVKKETAKLRDAYSIVPWEDIEKAAGPAILKVFMK